MTKPNYEVLSEMLGDFKERKAQERPWNELIELCEWDELVERLSVFSRTVLLTKLVELGLPAGHTFNRTKEDILLGLKQTLAIRSYTEVSYKSYGEYLEQITEGLIALNLEEARVAEILKKSAQTLHIGWARVWPVQSVSRLISKG